MERRKLFLCLEGADATGKTTIAHCLAERLRATYYKTPGGIFARFRPLLDKIGDPVSRYLFFRAAIQQDSLLIRDLLLREPVVCDRYIYSTFASHVALDERIASIHTTLDLVIPDLVVVLTATSATRQTRLCARNEVTPLERKADYQCLVDEIFRGLGFPVIDTTGTTPEEAASLILSTFLKTDTVSVR